MSGAERIPKIRIHIDQQLAVEEITGQEQIEDAVVATEIISFDREKGAYTLEGTITFSWAVRPYPVPGTEGGVPSDTITSETWPAIERKTERIPFVLKVPVTAQKNQFLNVKAKVGKWDLRILGPGVVRAQAELIVQGLSREGYYFRCGTQEEGDERSILGMQEPSLARGSVEDDPLSRMQEDLSHVHDTDIVMAPPEEQADFAAGATPNQHDEEDTRIYDELPVDFGEEAFEPDTPDPRPVSETGEEWRLDLSTPRFDDPAAFGPAEDTPDAIAAFEFENVLGDAAEPEEQIRQDASEQGESFAWPEQFVEPSLMERAEASSPSDQLMDPHEPEVESVSLQDALEREHSLPWQASQLSLTGEEADTNNGQSVQLDPTTKFTIGKKEAIDDTSLSGWFDQTQGNIDRERLHAEHASKINTVTASALPMEEQEKRENDGQADQVGDQSSSTLGEFFAKLYNSAMEEFTYTIKYRIVQEDESLQDLAQRYEVSVGELMRANKLNSESLQKGQLLAIPVR